MEIYTQLILRSNIIMAIYRTNLLNISSLNGNLVRLDCYLLALFVCVPEIFYFYIRISTPMIKRLHCIQVAIRNSIVSLGYVTINLVILCLRLCCSKVTDTRLLMRSLSII